MPKLPLILALALLATPALATTPPKATTPAKADTGFPPSMPLKDRIEIMNAAGYDVSPNGQTVYIWCGETKTPNRPVVGVLDLTGDGKPDYVVLGERQCPGDPPVPIKADIVSRRPDGVWQNILSVEGAPKPGPGTTDGWRDINVTKGTHVATYVHDTQTEQYSLATTIQVRKTFAQATTPARYAPGTVPTASLTQRDTMAAFSPGDIAAILTAAGYKRIAGAWTGCDGSSAVGLFEDDQLAGKGPVMDLNGDGQPEVMVFDGSMECYGLAGTQFRIVTPVPGGWKLIFDGGEGMPLVMDTLSRTGWRDVVAGGPGFCHQLYRYDGKAYAAFKLYEESPGACANR